MSCYLLSRSFSGACLSDYYFRHEMENCFAFSSLLLKSMMYSFLSSFDWWMAGWVVCSLTEIHFDKIICQFNVLGEDVFPDGFPWKTGQWHSWNFELGPIYQLTKYCFPSRYSMLNLKISYLPPFSFLRESSREQHSQNALTFTIFIFQYFNNIFSKYLHL